MNQLYIIDENFSFSHSRFNSQDHYHFIYYSDHESKRIILEEYLKKENIRFSFHLPSDSLKDISTAAKKEYLSYISHFPSFLYQQNPSLKKITNSKEWGDIFYYTDAYEKNPLSFKSYSLFCFIIFVNQVSNKVEPQKKISFLKDFFINCSLKKSGSEIYFKQSYLKETIKHVIRPIKVLFIFTRKKWLIHKYLGKRDFTKIKEKIFFINYPFYTYKNQYFSSNYIKEEQQNLEHTYSFIGLVLYKSNIPLRNFYRDLSHSNNVSSHYTVEEFLTFPAFFQYFFKIVKLSVVLAFKLRTIKNYSHCNINLIDSLKHQIYISITGEKVLETFAISHLLKKLSTTSEIIYLCENYAWERGLCFHAHKNSPDVNIKAYPHFAFGPHYTNFYKHLNLEDAYLPNEILVIGEYYKNLLNNFGWNNIKQTPYKSLRYQYLRDPIEKKTLPNKNLLILFSIDIKENISILEVIQKLELKDLHIQYRTHPGRPPENFLSKNCPWENVNNRPMKDLLLCTDTVICTQGGVTIEALILRNKIITISSNLGINLLPVTPEQSDCVVEANAQNISSIVSKTLELKIQRFPSFHDFFY